MLWLRMPVDISLIFIFCIELIPAISIISDTRLFGILQYFVTNVSFL